MLMLGGGIESLCCSWKRKRRVVVEKVRSRELGGCKDDAGNPI